MASSHLQLHLQVVSTFMMSCRSIYWDPKFTDHHMGVSKNSFFFAPNHPF